MRLLIDENVPLSIADTLESAGHDIECVAHHHRSADDNTVLALAVATDRVLLTFDSDFGRLIFAEHKEAPRAVIYLRSPPPSPAATVDRILRVLTADTPAIDGHFVSVDQTSRFHPLPRGHDHA